MRDPLYRSRRDRVIGGLAAGLARSLGVDVTWVRLGWVVLAFLTQGIAILIYVVLLFVIPEEPEGYVSPGQPGAGAGTPGTIPGHAEPGEGAVPGWTPPSRAGFADTTTTYAGAGTPGEGTTAGEAPPTAEPAARWQPPAAPPPTPLERWLGGSNRDSSRTAALVVGIVLVGVGAWLLIRRYVLIDFDLGWPVVAIILGAVLVLAAMRTSGRSG